MINNDFFSFLVLFLVFWRLLQRIFIFKKQTEGCLSYRYLRIVAGRCVFIQRFFPSSARLVRIRLLQKCRAFIDYRSASIYSKFYCYGISWGNFFYNCGKTRISIFLYPIRLHLLFSRKIESHPLLSHELRAGVMQSDAGGANSPLSGIVKSVALNLTLQCPFPICIA